MSAKIHVVNFGQAFGGLATVGYTLLNVDGTTKAARSTSGIVEYGTSTGIYGANIDYNQFDQLVVLWDTGGASPKYAIEENRITLAAIQEGTDFIRIIYNTLKNQAETFGNILRTLKALETTKNYDGEFKALSSSLKDLLKREEISLKEIKEALKVTIKAPDVTVPAPIVHLPAPVVTVKPTAVTVTPTKVTVQERDIKIPDYTGLIKEILSAVEKLTTQSVPKLNEVTIDVDSIKNAIEKLGRIHSDSHGETSSNIGIVNENVKSVGSAMQNLLNTIPTAQLLVVLKDSLSHLMERERQDNSQKLKNTLGV